MLRDRIRNFYFRIEFSALFRKLETVSCLYRDGRGRGADFFSDFYSRLLSFPFLYYEVEKVNDAYRPWDIAYFRSLPEGPLTDAYTKNSAVFLKLDDLIRKPSSLHNADEILADLDMFLQEVFMALKAPPASKGTKYIVRAVVGLTISIGMAFGFFNLTSIYRKESSEYEWASSANARYEKAVDDILRLQEALEEYYQDHQSYPRSSGGWDAKFAAFGESKDEWIPKLVPKYISELPEDPRQNENPREQYMYISDGADYKLISHNPENMQYITDHYPDLVDPSRGTWAFGVWSENAKEW